MHILFLGCSNLIKARIIPFLEDIPEINKIDIAKFIYQPKSEFLQYAKLANKLFDDFQQAIDNSKAELVYISIINSAHAEWVEKTLLKGFHVIVDKPSVTCIEDAKKIVEIARRKNLCLVESIVYTSHPQLKVIQDIFHKYSAKPSRLLIGFSFPPLKPDNFRNNKALGGGAVFDTAPYAISIGRILFGEQPKEVICRLNSFNEANGVEVSYTLLATYSEGRSLVGHFGFDTEYINRLTILGSDILIDIDRIFTTTPLLENEIRIKHKNVTSTVISPKGNSFILFIQEVIDNIRQNKFEKYYNDLIDDAEVISKIRKEIDNE